jgi:putative transposase
VKIIKGALAKDHVHLIIEYPPKLSISNLVKKLKGRTSILLQSEYPHIKKRYYGRHFWASGFGAWSLGNNSEKNVTDYLEHHNKKETNLNEDFILED